MPDCVKHSILHYQDPEGTEGSKKAVYITHLASRIADVVMQPEEDDNSHIYRDPIRLILGISEAELDALFEQRKQVLEMMSVISV